MHQRARDKWPTKLSSLPALTTTSPPFAGLDLWLEPLAQTNLAGFTMGRQLSFAGGHLHKDLSYFGQAGTEENLPMLILSNPVLACFTVLGTQQSPV